MTSNAQPSLLGKLLLPGYTDAGASTTFRSSTDQMPSSPGGSAPADTSGSDAKTEIHDNRTSVKGMDEVSETSKDRNLVENEMEHANQDGKFGFFPSTSRAVARQASHDAHEQQIDSSPRPPSPPEVSRRQLPVPSVAATSVAPQIGDFVGTLQLPPHAEDNDEDDNWASNCDVVTTVTSASSSILGTQFLQKVKPMSETEIERHNLRTNLHQYSSSDGSNRSLSTSPNSTARKSLLDPSGDDDDDDDDNDTPNEDNCDRGDEANNSSDVNSTVFSDVNSTSSEMGTVINVGNARQRMAEVEAMAALIEASPAYQDMSALDDANDEPRENIASKLALPTLESAGEFGNQDVSSSHASSIHTRTVSIDKSNTIKLTRTPTRRPHMNHDETATSSLVLNGALSRVEFNTARKRSITLSAPATPTTPYALHAPRVEDLLKSAASPKLDHGRHPPPSFALRSPGSAARHVLSTSTDEKTRTPRTRKLLRPIRRPDRSNVDRVSERVGTTHAESTPSAPLTPGQIALGPFRLAQKCFSFDSTLDDYTTALQSSTTPAKTTSWERQQQNQSSAHSRMKDQRMLKQSASWDVGWSNVVGNSSTIQLNPQNPRKELQFGVQGQEGQSSAQLIQRIRLDSDFSPLNTNVIPLQTPQRVEIEREDALDILACLVQRGVSLEKDKKQPSVSEQQPSSESKEDSKDDTILKELIEEASVEDVIDEIKKEIETLKEKNPERHAARLTAIDVLTRSHSYAMEMKRASLSASTWLKSIGKSEDASEGLQSDARDSETEHLVGTTSTELDKSDAANTPGTLERVEATTLKALLHTAQLEAKEKNDQAERLNIELSECRAEIGRLKSAASRIEPASLTANRSILDDAEDSIDSPQDDGGRRPVRYPSPILDDGSEANLSINNSLFRDDVNTKKSDHALREALEKANDMIRKLHENLKQFQDVDDSPPIIAVAENAVNGSSPQKESVGAYANEMNRTVNVRMLDGENFVTEWGELTPSLPPPPDHGLRSPIVKTVLDQWTSDGGLHESLMSWMDSIIAGTDLESVPPLTISSLDHQVRDGFAMHVLPLLLRRADVHLSVQTRAHRKTTYDMAVTVRRKTQLSVPFTPVFQTPRNRIVDDWSRQPYDNEQRSTTHSAVTAHISNSSTNMSPIYSNSNLPSGDAAIGQLTDGRSVKSSASQDEFPDEFAQNNQGIMGAIGGAIGGLLARRKQSNASPSRYSRASHFHASVRGQQPAPVFENLQHGSYDTEDVALEEQPYHRVVSAPPGRIGMTFVEFRGHAMVSDVAPDSPLSGWVFPSDILIAIDEIPVSGMRVRDIIKVLTNRKDRQRALRVISSHAMNEFTLNHTNFNEMPAG